MSETFVQPALTQTLEWIDQSTDGHVPKKGASRRKIRSQAMRSIGAARKQGGAYGKVNLRQQPVFVDDTVDQLEAAPSQSHFSVLLSPEHSLEELASSSTNQSRERNSFWFNLSQALAPNPASLSSQGYQSVKLEYGVDLPQLSALAKVHFGRAACEILAERPSMLSKIFFRDQFCYLDYVPSLYDRSSLIQDVTRCTLARARQSLSHYPTTPSATVLKLYGKALASLQQALETSARVREPEVLCATQILALFELLNYSDNGAWIRHTAGAARLIELRGPHGYDSEFEKSLLMAQVGPLFSEAILNNEACFLEKPEWQVVLKSTIIDGLMFCERSRMSISLWMNKYHIPSLLKRVTMLVCSDEPPNPRAVEDFLQEAREHRVRFLEWRFTYDCYMESLADRNITPFEHSQARLLLAVCATDLIFMNRIIVAIDPVGSWELEDQAQALARMILALEQEAASTNLMSTLFVVQKLGLSRAIIATEQDWRGARWQQSERGGGRRVIERRIFEQWCSLLGRKTK